MVLNICVAELIFIVSPSPEGFDCIPEGWMIYWSLPGHVSEDLVFGGTGIVPCLGPCGSSELLDMGSNMVFCPCQLYPPSSPRPLTQVGKDCHFRWEAKEKEQASCLWRLVCLVGSRVRRMEKMGSDIPKPLYIRQTHLSKACRTTDKPLTGKSP